MTNRNSKLSIGKLSELTGIPVPTLRTWERRYQFPVSDRTEGNHRLYDIALVPHLQLILSLLEQGYRARQIVGLPFTELQLLQGTEVQVDSGGNDVVGDQQFLEDWMAATCALNNVTCVAGFRLGLSQLGLGAFVLERVLPFLYRVGSDWHAGKIQIFQEHFATGLISQFLEEHWRLINGSNHGPKIILTSHPLERHTLSLHLLASMLVVEGFSIIWMGNNTPVEEIVSCAQQISARVIAMTFSLTTSPIDAGHFLQELDAVIAARIDDQPILVFGGAGAPVADELLCHSRWLRHNDLATVGELIRKSL